MELALLPVSPRWVTCRIRSQKRCMEIRFYRGTNVLRNPRKITIDQCKSKMAWFKTKYKEWCIPYTQLGWNFDEETQLFIANDAAWQSHFKVSYLFHIVKEFSKVYM